MTGIRFGFHHPSHHLLYLWRNSFMLPQGQDHHQMIKIDTEEKLKLSPRFAKLGQIGFLFFFFKGMIWLTIPWLAHLFF